jgi:hypothetical protein
VDRCVNCQFYDRHPTRQSEDRATQWGQCRREAPRLQPVNAKSHMIEGVWPHVRDDDWCGELKPTVRRAEPRIAEAAPVPHMNGFGTPASLRALTLDNFVNSGATASVMPPAGIAMGAGLSD